MSATREDASADPSATIAELRRERDAALAREAALAEILQIINRSPGDPAPVFDAILERATRLCEAACGQLATYDGEQFRWVAVHGDAPFVAEQQARGPMPPSFGVTWPRIVGGEGVVNIADLKDTDLYRAGHGSARSGADIGGARSLLSVALRKEDVLLGILTVYRQELRPFTDRETALSQSFAAQAVIAMENARLLGETREALEQQTATGEVLQVISRSTFDLEPVLEAVVAAATRLCSADAGLITIRETDGFRVVRSFAVEPGYDAAFRGRLIPVTRGTLSGRTALEARVVHIADLASDSEYTLSEAVELGPYRSVLGVPLLRDGVVIGTINLARNVVQPFTDKQIKLAGTFAAQAVIAMENARLLTETREALEQQTATAEVLGVINASPGDLAPVFDAILEKAVSLTEAVYGHLWRFDGEHFHPWRSHGDPQFAIQFEHLGPVRPNPDGDGFLGRVVRGEQVLYIADVRDTEAYRSGYAPVTALADVGGGRSVLTVALRKDHTVLGVLTVYRREVKQFSEKQISLLQNFAAQAVIAMENARLLTETREALEQQTATAEVTAVINSSPGDLAPVFDAMLDKAMRLCGVDHAALELYDGERFRAVAVHGASDRFADMLRQGYRAADSPASRTLLEGGRFVQIVDAAQVDLLTFRAAAELDGVRTVLFVPLRRDDALLGMIASARREVRLFSDKEIALLENFAAQAVIAMENARLLTETREALAQQTATAEVLQVINSSPGDLAPVFDAMLDKAMRLCGAEFGEFFITDGDQLRAVGSRGTSAAFAEFRRRNPAPPSPGSITARILAGEPVIHVADVKDDDHYRHGNPHRRALVDLGGARTFLSVTLLKDQAPLGSINIYRQEVRPFTEKQIALLQNFAAQAVIAMENARLITETREALEQQTATAEVLQVINSSPGDLAPVFDAMLERAVRLCEFDFSSLWTFDGAAFHPVAKHGVPERFWQYLQDHTPPPFARALAGEHLVHIPDVQAVPALMENDFARGLHERGLDPPHSLLIVALRKDDALLGVVVAYRREVGGFSDKQIALLQNFAAQAVIAMENARLLTETREALEYQTATSDVLQVISRSTFDLDPVLEYVIETAIRLCRAHMGSVFRLEDGLYRWAVGSGLDSAYREIEQQNPIVPGTDTLVGRVALEGRSVQIADAMADPDYAVKDEARLTRAHTMLGVPLLREGAPIGVIAMARDRVEPFTDKEVTLVTTFADQAVIAMENARLLNDLQGRTRDLQESLEYQTATSDVLKVISRSAGELDPVLQTLVETAARLCDAKDAFIFQLREDRYRIVASFGFTPEHKDFIEHNPFGKGRGTVTGRADLDRRVVHVPDVANDPEYTWVEGRQSGQFRTALGVPLLRDDMPIGVLFLSRSRVAPFTDKQVALITTFADQAVIAIENARLFNELRERTAELGRSVDELTLLREIGQAVSSTLDLRSVLATILTRSVALTGADAGAVFRYNRAERSFRLVEAAGLEERFAGAMRDVNVAEAETAMSEAAARRAPIQLADLAQRPTTPLVEASLAAGLRSALIVPLVGPERILGALVLQRRAAGEFPAETVRLMQTLASQSVLAIQNARLFREIAEKSEQLALASEHKSQFLANMSHELRTPLNAILGYAELLVDGIYGALPEKAQDVLERVQNNGKHLLALINDVLDLAKIEAGQLALTIEDYSLPELVKTVAVATEPLAAAKGLKFTSSVEGGMPRGHGDARRLAQVLLNLVGNAIKFTDAGEVEIRAALVTGQFVLTVRDTGPGIADADQDRIFGEFQQIDNADTRKKGGTGLGLAISKRMVEMQGGMISVESRLGAGSTFRVVLPVQVEPALEEAAE